jgi:hypothetical protein
MGRASFLPYHYHTMISRSLTPVCRSAGGLFAAAALVYIVHAYRGGSWSASGTRKRAGIHVRYCA